MKNVVVFVILVVVVIVVVVITGTVSCRESNWNA